MIKQGALLASLFLPVFVFANWSQDMSDSNQYRPKTMGDISNIYDTSKATLSSQGLNPDESAAKRFVDGKTPDQYGQSVREETAKNIMNAPSIKINLNDPSIKNSKFIQDHSDAITNGQSGAGIDCSKPQDYKIDWVNKSCESATTKQITCTTNKHIKLTTTVGPSPVVVTGQLANYGKTGTTDGDIIIKDKGTITAINLHFQNDHNLISCFENYPMYMNGQLFGYYHGHCGGTDSHMVYSKKYAKGFKVKKGQTLHFTWMYPNGGYWVLFWWQKGFKDHDFTYHENAMLSHTVASAVTTDSCAGLDLTNNGCVQTNSKITEPAATRSYHGFPLYEPWWAKEDDYTCGKSHYDNCTALVQQGCQQIASTCEDATCLVHKNTYSCPIKRYQHPSYVCGNTQYFCSDGKCGPVDQRKTSQKDFNKAVAGMAGVGAAGKSAYDSQDASGNVSIFAGHSEMCKKGDLGTGDRDCCNMNTWFGSCSDSAKKLHKAYKEQRAVDVGEVCVADSIFGCLRHGEVYCVFGSKMATDVQVQGRSGQLGIGFGDGDNPNCRGLQPDELNKINFGKIDFSNFYNDMDNKMDGAMIGKTNQALADRIANDMKRRAGG